ncbi:MAG: hypothetical protein OK456_10200, partial [Thaumarchaeota archaeon]|nr:hypothetical protein [Nitrososphaerota archaeon]
MRSSIALAALVCFALVNTAFLGYYLYSDSGLNGGSSANAADVQSVASSSTATIAATTTGAASTNATESTGTQSTSTSLQG